jgi:hypothetical protein
MSIPHPCLVDVLKALGSSIARARADGHDTDTALMRLEASFCPAVLEAMSPEALLGVESAPPACKVLAHLSRRLEEHNGISRSLTKRAATHLAGGLSLADPGSLAEMYQRHSDQDLRNLFQQLNALDQNGTTAHIWEQLWRDQAAEMGNCGLVVLPGHERQESLPGQEAGAAPPWPAYMSAADLADRLGLNREATRKKLERLAGKHDCRIENESPRKGDATWFYHVQTVLPYFSGP